MHCLFFHICYRTERFAQGTSLALSARRHPSPCPSPTKRAFTPVYDGLWGEGTLWHCSAQSPAAFAYMLVEAQ
jgi:hypothetical protein